MTCYFCCLDLLSCRTACTMHLLIISLLSYCSSAILPSKQCRKPSLHLGMLWLFSGPQFHYTSQYQDLVHTPSVFLKPPWGWGSFMTTSFATALILTSITLSNTFPNVLLGAIPRYNCPVPCPILEHRYDHTPVPLQWVLLQLSPNIIISFGISSDPTAFPLPRSLRA